MEYGLIGEKLGHSFSKEIHNQIGDYDYVLKEIPREELVSFIKGKDFKGINVTIPYKSDVIPYLDFVDENAKQIGAVNTVVNKKGKLYGYNTDFIGLKRLILSMKLDLNQKKVLILGTGGTSKTAGAVAKNLGAASIFIVSRKESENTITYEEAVKQHSDAQIIINTTPCGMFPSIEGCPIELSSFTQLQGLVDVIYNPLRTNLVLAAQEKKIKAQGGLYMLVQQAIAAAELFFDRELFNSRGDAIYKNLLGKKQNIVLTGMPGSGKSTVGKEIAKKLNMTLFDTDKEILRLTGKAPSQIITEEGEEKFRQIESDVCKELSLKNNVIIATGGGAVLRKENIIHLKHNGKIFFIDRDLENICPTENRPLSNSKDKLEALYKVRYPIYTSTADFHIKSDNNIQNTVQSIITAFTQEI